MLQRASLLAYYDTLLEMGGDDVQQLCDAGEEEFLEIMALVGMASKPLHVRRLQKSLHEWAMNPGSFQAPLSDGGVGVAAAAAALSAFSPEHAPQSRSPFSPSQAYSPSSLSGSAGSNAMSTSFGGSFASSHPAQQQAHALHQSQSQTQNHQHHHHQPPQHHQQQQQHQLHSTVGQIPQQQHQHQQQLFTAASNMMSQQIVQSGGSLSSNGSNNGGSQATPALTDEQMTRLAAVADE